MQVNFTSLDCADAYQVADNLDMALNVFRRRVGGKPQTALDVYIQSVLTSLRRDILRHAAKVQGTNVIPGFPALQSNG